MSGAHMIRQAHVLNSMNPEKYPNKYKNYFVFLKNTYNFLTKN